MMSTWKGWVLGFACLLVGCGSRTALPGDLLVYEDGVPIIGGGLACPITPAYLLSYNFSASGMAQAVLTRFDADRMTFETVVAGFCRPDLPVDLAADRGGRLYFEYQSESIHFYMLEPSSGQCEPTGLTSASHDPGAITFSASAARSGETLYYAGYDSSPPGSSNQTYVLATVSAGNEWTTVGRPAFGIAPLAGTGKGDLFTAYEVSADAGRGWAIGRVDEGSASVRFQWAVPSVPGTQVYGLVPWRGDFYVFINNAGDGPTAVMRFRPADGGWTQVAQLDFGVVAATVSICAPTQ